MKTLFVCVVLSAFAVVAMAAPTVNWHAQTSACPKIVNNSAPSGIGRPTSFWSWFWKR